MSAVIRVDFLGDARSAEAGARRTERAIGRVEGGTNRSTSATRRFGAAVGNAARRYGPLAAAAGAGAVLKIGKDSIEAASRVEQAFGAVDVVFGRNANRVKAWARSAANDVGLARAEYAELATVAGSMLKNTGIEDYANQTRSLIRLGADLAATYGGTTKDAMESISALMRGETDPIEKYGVSIKQSGVNAELAAQGLGKLEGRQKTQAEQQARLKLLFEQTTAAQGQYSRESGTLAVKQQELGAKWENLKAVMGDKLLPVATRFVGWLGDAVEGSNGTGRAARKLAEIYGTYLTPIINSGQRAWDRINRSVNKATGSSDGMRKVGNKVLAVLEKWAPLAGGRVASAITKLAVIADGAITTFARMYRTVNSIVDAFKAAWSWAGRLGDKLGGIKVPSGLGALGGLLSSGEALPGGLGRAAGMGAFGAYSPRVNVATGPTHVQVFLDGVGLSARQVRYYRSLARAEARAEISSQLRTRRQGS